MKGLGCRIDVVPSQGRHVPVIAATGACTSSLTDQGEFSSQPSFLLANVVLITVVGVGVLAFDAAEASLPSTKLPAADYTVAILAHA